MSQFFTSGGQRIEVFSFSIGPSNEYSGQISFRMDWLDLLAVQGTLKSFFQYCNSKSVLQHSAVWGFPDSSVSKESTYNAGDPGLIPGLGRSAGEQIGYPLQSWVSLVAQQVKNLPAM